VSERAKSVLLFLLVLLSILLTCQLWFGRQTAEEVAENGYEPVYFEEPRPLAQMLLPERISIYGDGQCYRVRPGDPDFNLFWGALSGMLQEISEPGHYYYGESLPQEAELCLSLQFKPFLPLGPESVWLKSRRSGELAGMQIWRSADRCWAVLEVNESAAELLLLPPQWGAQLAGLHDQFVPAANQLCEELAPGELKLSRGAAVTVTAPIYVPAGEPVIDELVLKPELLDRELLLKTFFINRNLVREIKERDGGLIYTDGEQGMRLGNGLDYSHPRLEQKPVNLSYTAALLTAGKLLGYHGGWPGNLRLVSLHPEDEDEDSPKGLYRAQWYSYFEGYPLLGDSGVVMSYYHGGLLSYRRSLYELHYTSGNKVPVSDFQEALKAAVMILADEGVEQFTLEEMDLAYYFTGMRAIPVWLIRLNGRELILKAVELIPPEGWEP
jgi:hypothetical protein